MEEQMNFTQQIISMMDDLVALGDRIELVNSHYDMLFEDIVPVDIAEKIRDLEEERATEVSGLIKKKEALEQKIKDAVVMKGETINGERLKAVYVQGRTSWDNGALDGYAVAHPEILAMKKVGNPGCRIVGV